MSGVLGQSGQDIVGGQSNEAAASAAPAKRRGKKKKGGHFHLPNTTSILPDYANAEQDTIRSAFNPYNHQSLRSLPNHLNTHSVMQSKRAMMDNNRKLVAPARKMTYNNLFSQFEYMPDKYGAGAEIKSQERLANQAKHMAISGGKAFVPSSGGKTFKHEAMDRSNFKYMEDPYGAAEEDKLRHKWLEDSKILNGAFRPVGRTKPLGSKTTRSMLTDILKEMRHAIEEDWDEYKIDVVVTPDDLITVKIDLNDSGDHNTAGLEAYFNCMATNNAVFAKKYSLKKAVECWCVRQDDGWLHFSFRPPWCKYNPTKAYLTLHPELKRAAGSQQQRNIPPSRGSTFSHSRECVTALRADAF